MYEISFFSAVLSVFIRVCICGEMCTVFIMYIVSVVLHSVFYTFKMCKRVHTAKYSYMLKILILTRVQINFLEEGFLLFLFLKPQILVLNGIFNFTKSILQLI